MNWNAVLGTLSTITFLIPVAIIINKRLFKCSSLLILMVYYILESGYNLITQGMIPMAAPAKRIIGIFINYLDAPLMLAVLLFFCHTPSKRRFIKTVWVGVVLYELITIMVEGITVRSNVFILAVDILIILIYSFKIFMSELKGSLRNGKKIGRTLMIVSILFSYGSYGFIYLVYYIINTNAVSDVYLLFFMSSIVSCIAMSIGLIYVSRRLKELEDTKLTRKELQMFFNV